MSTPNPKSRRRWLRGGTLEMIALFGGSALLLVGGFYFASRFIEPAPPREIRIAAGGAEGAYFGYAQRYAAWLARYGVELSVLETAGSVENLALLLDADDPVDLALVQGGVATVDQREAVSGLGSVFYEPIWLLAPAAGRSSNVPDNAPETSSPELRDLAGARIAVGPEGSGTRPLALRMLAANGIDADDAELLPLGPVDAAPLLADGRLDLLFYVGSADAPLLLRLGREGAVRIQDLARAEAYARWDRSLTPMTLPAGALDLAADLPPADRRLVAVTANLVARPGIHPALVDLLLQAMTEVHGEGSLLAAPGTFPTPKHSDFPLNRDARRYYEHGPPFLRRYLPFWAATWIDRTKVMLLPLLALMIPLSKLLPPVYRWRIRRRITRWYVQLRRIDLELALGKGRDLDALADALAHIEAEAAQVEVPLSYADQLYNLRLHIQLLQRSLVEARERTAARASPPLGQGARERAPV